MIAVYLLAAHLVGDYLLQTRWQAAGKLTIRALRARHVAAYCIPFVALLGYLRPSWSHAAAFVVLLAVLHYLTDSRRFTSTPGEWLVWRIRPHPDEPVKPFGARIADAPSGSILGPNPWPPISLMIDQTLHVCQLAVLGGLLLT